MAQKVQIVLVDDLDGGDATETVRFALDGTAYEIDLSVANAARLRDVLAPYIGVARKAGRPARQPKAARAPRSRATESDTAAIRAWAKEKGMVVSERGRIPAHVRDAYRSSH